MTQFLRKLIKKVIPDKNYIVPVQIHCKKERYGSEYGGWTICPDKITKESIIYSFGIGHDISLDLALIEHFGVTVYAFDPTPRSIAWLNTQKLPDKFKAFEFGIANHNGMAKFYLPKKPEYVSYYVVRRSPTTSDFIQAPVYRLQTIMEKLGHTRIDILKMDIEGFEYGVIRDIVASNIPIEQLLIEFHHRFKKIKRSQTKKAIKLLNKKGYKIFEISEGGRGKEYSFLFEGSVK